jgi:hypothetical protein
MPNVLGGWDFVLDGQAVDSMAIPWTTSKDAAYFAAEEITSDPVPSGDLGPVEFRNLSYLNQSSWHEVESLTALSGCSVVTPKTPSCDNLPYGITVLGPNDVIAGTGEQRRERGETLWATQWTLTLNAPHEATFTVDDHYEVSGGSQISLPPGNHVIHATEYVPVSDEVRLRFYGWADGYPYAGRKFDLSSDAALGAVYVTQYNLTIISPLATNGGGWHDAGSTANYSIAVFPITFDSSGVWVFIGWYDQNGNPITIFGGGSIVMNAPLTLQARYLHL